MQAEIFMQNHGIAVPPGSKLREVRSFVTHSQCFLPCAATLFIFAAITSIADIMLGYYIEVVVELIDKRTPVGRLTFTFPSGAFSKCMTSARSELPCAAIMTRLPSRIFGAISFSKYGTVLAIVSLRLSPSGSSDLSSSLY